MYFPPQAVCMLPVTTRIPVASVRSLLGYITMYVLHILCLPRLYLALSPPSRLIDAQPPVPVAEEEATQTDGSSTGEADAMSNCVSDSEAKRRGTPSRKLYVCYV
jgi:hypothetical protein